MKVALIGDYDPEVTAHQAIPRALELAARGLETGIDTQWIHSASIDIPALADFDAVWCVPLSPYADGKAVIGAIEFARRQDLPFLGTCAGYQHAVLEYARHVLGLEDAESSEDHPHAERPVITALSCSLIDVAAPVAIDADSRLGRIYGVGQADETYHCRFGVNPQFLPMFAGSAFKFSCHDADGQPRAFELEGHRFFFGTAFQPERAALAEKNHPLIAAFLEAAL